MHIDRRLLGWGAFFILVGAIPLAVRGGYLDVEQVRSWPNLWPLLLIGWGLGLVLRRTPVDWLGGAIAAVTLGLMGGGALAAGFGGIPALGGCNSTDPMSAFQTQRGTIAGGRLSIEFNCGSLAVETADGSDWSVSGSEARGRSPRVTASGSAVRISGAQESTWFGDNVRARWTVAVPRAPAVDLGITLNAGDGRADLSGANLASVGLTVNAGSFRLFLDGATQLGDINATVNAGDAKMRLPGGDRSANLSLNAGNLQVCVPADAAVRVRWSGALGSNDLDQAGLTKVGDDTWTSSGFAESQPHLELHVSANAGSFGLSRGGTCGA